MGGIGSGSWYRWNRREYLDSHIAIDIRQWKREGMLWPGNWFDCTWSVNDEVTDNVKVQVYEDRVTLYYKQQAQDMEESVNLTYTDCNYGGQRVWFVCPVCNRRTAKLYGQISHFVCRCCCNIPYKSQSESSGDRSIRKARKIRRRLDASMSLLEPIWKKPKGMHYITFMRLRAEVQEAEEVQFRKVAKRLRARQ